MQKEDNRRNNITPESIRKEVTDVLASVYEADYVTLPLVAEEVLKHASPDELRKAVRQFRKEMVRAAKELRFEDAARLRDQIEELEELEVVYG